ncbi:hypothetical protein GWK47_042568 [Chionoecetes opilio]|uniref:Uncharacterized protein n=1 Tax=Chionoecetes opilio TaxID=41210 RepID=A0A8J4Y8R3_CHIOP|nr:hypothetical protein GWK47_042568 [Chionoecetes opilio]
MAAFSEDPPQVAALHWDGKMLRDVLGSDWDHVKTLAVLVSGPPPYPEGKLLGVPVIDSSTGTAQAEASRGFAGGMGAYGSDHCPCVLTQRPATVEYIGELPSFWSNSLTGRCSTWPADPPSRRRLVL